MTIYRSYFSKNNTLISGNKTNNAKNPVCEISYGTPDKELSRFLFDIDLSLLKDRINNGIINSNNIVNHTLNMTNTIRFAEEYVGKKSYATTINRASNFTLDLFGVNQEWDEGTSYDFIYGVNYLNNAIEQESNWVNRKLNTPWDSVGAYSAGTNTIIGSQYFRSGSENIKIDISNLVNSGLTGTTSSNGLGLKFQDSYENTATNLREAVAFYSKYTNTVYEPYIETVIDDTITDDRNFFFLDKENSLYLYSPDNVTINNVTIYDYNDNIHSIISGASIVNVSKGVNKIILTIDSDTYPDAVIFRDVWNVTVNGKTKDVDNMFYLISQDNYFNFNNQMNFDNYSFSFKGIKEREKISSNYIRKIKVNVKEMYPNQNNFIPLDIEYRIFTTAAYKYELDYVPFTKVSRTNYGYEFNIDTSWLIPQDYKIQIRLKNGDYYENKEILSFKIVNEGINASNDIIPTTTAYIPTTTEYVATTTEYIPTTTEYAATTTEYVPTTTEYIATTTVVPTTTEYVPTTTIAESTMIQDYGYLYNGYAVDNASLITASGWTVPSYEQYLTLYNYLVTSVVGKLREVGTAHWVQTGTATNATGFNGRGAGARTTGGVFGNIKQNLVLWHTTPQSSPWVLLYSSDEPGSTAYDLNAGFSIRLLKDNTSLTNGQTGTYTGNDGKLYSTICIGAQEWLSENLAETKYRDNSDIINVINDITWENDTTGARCSYNNE